MFLLIIVVLSCFIAFISAIFLLCDGSDGDFITFLCSGIIFVGCFIFSFVGMAKLNKQPWNISDWPYRTQYIAAMNDSNQVHGKHYARRGYIDEDLYYQYLVKMQDGGLKANKVKASKATLYYSDDTYRVDFYNKTRKWLCFEEKDWFCKIYLPEGSITDDYSIDLE